MLVHYMRILVHGTNTWNTKTPPHSISKCYINHKITKLQETNLVFYLKNLRKQCVSGRCVGILCLGSAKNVDMMLNFELSVRILIYVPKFISHVYRI